MVIKELAWAAVSLATQYHFAKDVGLTIEHSSLASLPYF